MHAAKIYDREHNINSLYENRCKQFASTYEWSESKSCDQPQKASAWKLHKDSRKL